MTRATGQEERLAMLGRLPAMARILRGVFVAEKKPALPMELACVHLADSFPTQMAAGRGAVGLRAARRWALPGWELSCCLHPSLQVRWRSTCGSWLSCCPTG